MLRVLLLALALLAAQHSALAHELWHADPGQVQSEDDKKLCELHSALGAVLGVLDATSAQPALADLEDTGYRAPIRQVWRLTPCVLACRGPPARS